MTNQKKPETPRESNINIEMLQRQNCYGTKLILKRWGEGKFLVQKHVLRPIQV